MILTDIQTFNMNNATSRIKAMAKQNPSPALSATAQDSLFQLIYHLLFSYYQHMSRVLNNTNIHVACIKNIGIGNGIPFCHRGIQLVSNWQY